ncbi:hypothetical protein B0T20DRAFT_478712 [Sordaria brevicollis]|uniref:Uncharacterized protein n=1 Tax=Sordaria brevicollis TaxID=83679 RepID=A0AAE0UCP8_SORBR|nr:hypothetical protein B0T20DRAFT_478712 [Sordaria brevicollis]
MPQEHLTLNARRSRPRACQPRPTLHREGAQVVYENVDGVDLLNQVEELIDDFSRNHTGEHRMANTTGNTPALSGSASQLARPARGTFNHIRNDSRSEPEPQLPRYTPNASVNEMTIDSNSLESLPSYTGPSQEQGNAHVKSAEAPPAYRR